MRPVAKGWCKYESLVNGSLSLYDVAVMNEAIEIKEENSYRMTQAASKQ